MTIEMDKWTNGQSGQILQVNFLPHPRVRSLSLQVGVVDNPLHRMLRYEKAEEVED